MGNFHNILTQINRLRLDENQQENAQLREQLTTILSKYFFKYFTPDEMIAHMDIC